MGNNRILVVEDDAVSGKYLQQDLTNQGYDVPRVLFSCEELIEKTAELHPDLILMDVKLQGKGDGIDAAESIAARYDIPVIYLTAHTDPDTLVRAKITKPYGFLIKPVNISELHIAVEFALFRHQMEKKLKISEERYRAVVETMPLLICRFLPGECTITFVNDEYCRYSNLHREDLLGRSLLDLIPEPDRGKAVDYYRSLSKERQVVTYEYPLAGIPGERWQRWTVQGIFNNLGVIIEYQAIGEDITDRKIIEDSLREAHKQLQDIINFLPDAALVINNEKKVIAWNRAMEKMTGVPADAVIGKGDHEYSVHFYGSRRPMLIDMVGRDMSEYEGMYNNVVTEDDTIFAESFIPSLPSTGREIYLWGKASPLYDGERNIIGGIETVRDITEIKRIETALRESEKKFRLLFEQSADAQLLIDGERFVDCNMAAVNLLGAGAKEQILGKSPHELSPEIQPNGTPTVARMNEILKFVYELDNISFEWVHLGFDGRQVPVDVTYTIIPISGKLMIHAVLKDITIRKLAQSALRRSEQQYRVLVETMSDGLVQGDEQGTVTFVNDRFCEMVGYLKNEIIGNLILDMISEDDRENFWEEVRGKKHARERAYEIALKNKTGRKISTIVSPRILVDELNRPAGIVAVFTDISERKYLERQILEISMREQQRIGRDLHDDLGQILTGTGFLCESLVKKLVNKELPEADEARSVFGLINEAKEHTRLLSRGLSPVEIDSGGIIAALERFAQTVEGIYSVSCTLRCDAGLDINDSMVETQFHYIVLESVTNAIKHGKAKHIVITLQKKKGQVHLSIRDDGVGINDDVDLFKGMGLRIMRYRANAIGASIQVTKNRGKGSTVSCVVRR